MKIPGPLSIPLRSPVTAPTKPVAPREVTPNAAPAVATAKAAASGVAALKGEPTLWEILTPAEREFFDQLAAHGALTYGPGSKPATPSRAPTGQRIDVRG